MVLCGGTSSRMGTDKALLEVAGETLVARAARRLGEVAEPVLLAPGTRGRLEQLGFDEVGDEVMGAGPLGGLIAGLAASPHELVAVVAVDLPHANGPLLRWMADAWDGEDAVVPVTEDGSQPLHAVYSVEAVPALRSFVASGGRSVRVALGSLRVRSIGPDEWRRFDPDGRFTWNLNRPEDLGRVTGS